MQIICKNRELMVFMHGLLLLHNLFSDYSSNCEQYSDLCVVTLILHTLATKQNNKIDVM